MLATRTSARTFGTCKVNRSKAAIVRCNVSVKPDQVLAAFTAGALLLAPAPAFASLPPGFKGPQGSDTAAIEAQLDALIEQRTGKATPLPDLKEVPQVKEETKVEKPAPAMPLVAPMAPAVMEPPPPPAALAPAAVAPATVEPVIEEEPAVPTPPAKPTPPPAPVVVEEAPAPVKTGLQQRDAPAAATAASSTTSGNSGLLIGGGVAVLGVVAAAALAGNNQSAEQTPAAAAPPATTAAGASPAEGDAAEAAPASSEGTSN